MKIGKEGIDLIKKWESLHDGNLKLIGLQPKMCPAGYWTEGYGNVIKDKNGKMLKGVENKNLAYRLSTIKNEAEASEQLKRNIDENYGLFIDSLGLNLNQYQFDALCSFAYNCGKNALKNSTLLKRIKKGSSEKDIRAAFLMWNKAGGKVLDGLTNRRNAEANLYFKK